MSTLATFDVALRADLRNFNQGMQQAGSGVRGFMSHVASTASGFLVANVAMRGFSMAVAGIKDAIIGYNARMEQAQIGFTTLLGSASKATAFIKDLQHFAAVTPFDFPGLQKSANLMLAMGFKAKDVIPMLTKVGDAMAAMGNSSSESVGYVVRALGQMKGAGRVNSQDMMQLTSQGIRAWDFLAKKLGKTTVEVRNMAKKGLIPAQVGIDAIMEGIQNSNMAGAMAAQAKTFTGAMSTIKDSGQQLVGGALKPLFEAIRDLVVPFSLWISNSKQAVEISKKVAQTLTNAITNIKNFGKGIVEGIKYLQHFWEGIKNGIGGADVFGAKMMMLGAQVGHILKNLVKAWLLHFIALPRLIASAVGKGLTSNPINWDRMLVGLKGFLRGFVDQFVGGINWRALQNAILMRINRTFKTLDWGEIGFIIATKLVAVGTAVVHGLQDLAGKVVDFIRTLPDRFANGLTDAGKKLPWAKFGANISAFVKGFLKPFAKLIPAGMKPFLMHIRNIAKAIGGFLPEVRELALRIFPRLADAIGGALKLLKDFVTWLLSGTDGAKRARDVILGVAGAFAAIMAVNGIVGMLGSVASSVAGLATSMLKVASVPFGPIKTFAKHAKSLASGIKGIVSKSVKITAKGFSAAQKALDTFKTGWDALKSKSITLSEKLITPAGAAMEAGQSFLEGLLKGIGGGIGVAITGLVAAGLIAAAAAVGGAAVLALGGAIVAAIAVVLAFPEQVGQVVGGLTALIVNAFFSLIGAIGTVLGAVVGPFVDAIVGFFTTAFAQVGTIIGAVLSGDWGLAFSTALDLIKGVFINFPLTIGGIIVNGLTGIIGHVVEFGGQFLGAIGDGLGQVVAFIGPWFQTLIGGFIEGFNALIGESGRQGIAVIGSFMEWIGAIPGHIADMFTSIVALVGSWVGTLAGAFGDLASSIGKAFANGVIGLVEGAINSIIRGINSIQLHFDGLDLGPLGRIAAVNWNGFQLGLVNLPRFEKGAWDTGNKSFPAIIDPHEMIVPRKFAEDLRANKGSGDTHYHEHLTVMGDVKADRPEAIADVFRRLKLVAGTEGTDMAGEKF